MTIKKLLVGLLLFSPLCSLMASESQIALKNKAMKGDYQAQRNLAWSYVNPHKKDKADPVLGCAWYLVILQSRSPKIHEGDYGNVKVYCDTKLNREKQAAAMAESRKLTRKIYGK